ncbi:MAG: hypothetical protein AB9903_21790 [Vulcanimicrobiota bacterium]
MVKKPSAKAKDRAPASTGKDKAPTDTGKDKAPADTGKDKAPADTGKDKAPADTGKDKALADTGKDRAPADTGKVRAPADTGKERAPAGSAPGSQVQVGKHPAGSTPPAEDTKEAGVDRKGIWEACYESGVVIGYFEGTPKQIATFIINTVEDGSYIRKLNFLQIPIKRIPEKLIKQTCCGRNYSKNDRFCSRCGKSLEMNKKLTSKIRLEVNC